MKRFPAPPRRLVLTTLVCLAGLAGLAAFEKGDKAWSKRNATPLLGEPKPLATAAGTVGFAEEMRVEEVRGLWLRVKAPKVEGWIFAGNVAEEKPSDAPPPGLVSLSASDTDTAAAARPLTAAAEGFAVRHDAAAAKADLDWLELEAAKVSPAALETFLRDHQKGEFQP